MLGRAEGSLCLIGCEAGLALVRSRGSREQEMRRSKGGRGNKVSQWWGLGLNRSMDGKGEGVTGRTSYGMFRVVRRLTVDIWEWWGAR